MASEFTEGASTRLSDSMFEELNALAKKEQRSVSNMIRVLITEALYYRKLGVSDNELLQYLKSKNKEIEHPQIG